MDKMASQKNEYPIHPLSPVIEKEDDISEYKIYKGCLNSAFKNPDVRNIAITGNFGIGKSRFLYYFAKRKKYLFVSGCSFYEQGKPDDDDSVEYNLLYQLLLGCKQKKESRRKARSFFQKAGFFVTILFLLATVFLLSLAPKLGPYLRALGLYNKAGSNWIHVLVYIGFAISLCVDALWLIIDGKRVLKLKSISLELGGAKVEAEKAESESPLYKYREELIQTLVESADKIDRTVIFEDMDRLKTPRCVELFTKLWELNKLVNLCLDDDKPIRFVYVIHDELFSLASDEREPISSGDDASSKSTVSPPPDEGKAGPRTETTVETNTQAAKHHAPDSYVQLKFFDYILPIVPSMSDKDAIVAAQKLIQDDDVNELITLLAPYLSDYRLLRNIANEYDVFCRIYNERFNLTKDGSLKISNKVTVNGKETTGASADGTYTFIITGVNNYFSTHEIKITNGESNSVQVDNLLPGTYTVTEAAPTGVELVGGNFLRVEVEANNTANIPTADFTNNKEIQIGFIDSLICFFSPGWSYLKNLFARGSKAHCQEDPPRNIPNEEKKKILGFSIYKNLMPDDYKKIRDGKSVVFPGSQDRGDDTDLPESIRLLIKNEWLDDTCLRFVGYNREELKKCIIASCEPDINNGQLAYWKKHEPELYLDVAVSEIKRVFSLSGHGESKNYWIKNETELCYNSLKEQESIDTSGVNKDSDPLKSHKFLNALLFPTKEN